MTKWYRGRTPLLWAVHAGNLSAIRLLIRFGADVETADHSEANVFFRANATSTASVSVMSTLVEEIKLRERSEHSIAPQIRGGASIFHSRTTQETDLYIKKLLNTPDKLYNTPLKVAAMYGLTDMASFLLDSGAETETIGATSSPLFHAIFNSNHTAVQLLLRHKARLELLNRNLYNILHVVAIGADFPMISIMFQHGICCIDTKKVDERGNKPVETFELDRPFHLIEDEATTLRCKEFFLQLLESIEIKTATVGHECWRDRREGIEANNHETTIQDSDSSDDDEFFDIHSDHGVESPRVEELGEGDAEAGNRE